MATLHCTVTTPEKRLFEGQVRAVIVPAEDGELGILPRHAPLIASLGFGELRLDVEGGGRASFFLDGGFVQVLEGRITVLAAAATATSNLDTAAEEARLVELRARRPTIRSSFEEKDEHARAVAVTSARLKLARNVG